MNLAVRENPRFGEYRFIQFAWKKKGGQQIRLDLDYSQGSEEYLPRDEQLKRQQELSRLRARQRQAERDVERLEKVISPAPHMAARLRSVQQSTASFKLEVMQLENAVGRQDAGGALRYRYFAGAAGQIDAGVAANRLSDRIPEQWTIVTRDLYQDTNGGGDITGITLSSPDGERAMFDHIYLGRTAQDFDRSPPQAPPLPGGN